MPYLYFHIWDPRCRHYSRVYTLDGIILKVYSNQRYWCVCVCGGGQPLFPRDLRFFSFSVFQFFSFKAGSASSPFSLAPTKTLDECWWYLTWSVRRTCHETISISEFCDSFTAATVLNLSFLKHVWVQRPFHEQKIINQNEPREQTFCLTSVCENAIPEFWPFENGTTM